MAKCPNLQEQKGRKAVLGKPALISPVSTLAHRPPSPRCHETLLLKVWHEGAASPHHPGFLQNSKLHPDRLNRTYIFTRFPDDPHVHSSLKSNAIVTTAQWGQQQWVMSDPQVTLGTRITSKQVAAVSKRCLKKKKNFPGNFSLTQMIIIFIK